MLRIGEIRKKGVEVGVEMEKLAQRRERLTYAIAPPMPVEAPQLVGAKPETEREPRRRTESAAKTGSDGVLGGVEPEIVREAGVDASDRLARLEQRAGSVEKYCSDHTIRSIVAFPMVISRDGFTAHPPTLEFPDYPKSKL